MSYDIERVKLGRRPVLLCEMDLDKCANTYGETVTNLLTQPEDFSHGDWGKNNLSITANTAIAPDGNLTADTYTADNLATASWMPNTIAVTGNPSRNLSCYLKDNGGTYANLYFYTAEDNDNWVRFNLVAGTYDSIFEAAITGYTIIAVGNGWYRLSIVFTTTGQTNFQAGVRHSGWTGDGLKGFYIWGAQLTEGATLHGYGAATCAAGGAAGLECYNTRVTCQDPANYNKHVPLTVKLSNILIEGENYIHAMDSAELAPTVINPEKGLGQRASIKITFSDFPHHDRGFDPYAANRSYDASAQGSFFAKLIARNPYYAGRPLRIKSGYIADPFSISDFQTRNYIIDNITGPDAAGRVTVTAKDILKLADDKRAEVPAASTGLLTAAITAAATTLTVTSGTEGEYNAESDYIRVGDEIILSPPANRSANVFSNLTRATWNTTAAAAELGDSVQACKHLNAVNVADLVEDLLKNYAAIPAGYITDADWTAEQALWYSTTSITALITEPEGVTGLINELATQFFFRVWWNEITQKILFKATVPPIAGATIPEINDQAHLIDNTVKITRADTRRLSRVIFYYNPRNPIDVTEPEDYQALHVLIDSDAEGADEHADTRRIVIFGRFITSESIAVQTAGRLLSRFRDTPRTINFNLDAKDADLITGDLVNIDSARVQGADGSNQITQFEILSFKELTNPAAGTHYKYQGLETKYSGRYGFVGPDTLNDYDVESDANKALYAFICLDTGLFSDTTQGYRII